MNHKTKVLATIVRGGRQTWELRIIGLSNSSVLVVREVWQVMNPTSIPRGDGQARALAGERSNFHEARLWARAKLNLMLLYGGRRSGACNGQGGVKNGVSSSFGYGASKSETGRPHPVSPAFRAVTCHIDTTEARRWSDAAIYSRTRLCDGTQDR